MKKLSFAALQERAATSDSAVLLSTISGGLSDDCHDTITSTEEYPCLTCGESGCSTGSHENDYHVEWY